jgi:hypothetical protein
MDVGMKWMVIDACQDERDIVILDEPLARRYQESKKETFKFQSLLQINQIVLVMKLLFGFP